jgi:hypothetical protein
MSNFSLLKEPKVSMVGFVHDGTLLYDKGTL